MRRFALGILPLLASGTAALAAQPAPPPFDSLAFRGPARENPFFPLRPGTTAVLAVRDGGATLVDSIVVTDDTVRIAGVTATVVRDVVRHRGALVEETRDWYATDSTGTVWYLGEDTRERRRGGGTSTAGSWRAGRDGARAGIIMLADPRIGAVYRQEYRRGVAEDVARVASVGDTVTVRAGRFTGCVTTEDWSPLEPGVRERKTYCPGVGLVRERTVAGGAERSELTSLFRRP
jgi:hypothetical protein